MGDIPRSREALEECLALRRQLFQDVKNNYPLAVSLNNLGVVLKTLLLHSQAEECLRESLRLRLVLYGDPAVDINEDSDNRRRNYHPAICHAWQTLGVLLVSMARYREAREYLEHALDARKLLFGDVHADVAITLHSLADLCMCEKRYGDAGKLLHEAIDVRVALYGEKSPLVLATMRKLWRLTAGVGAARSSTQDEKKTPQDFEERILFGSEQETEVFLRIKANILTMDSASGGEGGGADHPRSLDSPPLTPFDAPAGHTESPTTSAACAQNDLGSAHTALLDLVMNAFEEDRDSNAAAQFLKFEAVRKAQVELNRLSRSNLSGQYSNVEGTDAYLGSVNIFQ
jgi:tetratricopeptide (TPR) repeat protein